MIERLFRVKQSGSNIRTELIGGATTFMAMAYIIFVQPAVLSQAGMDFGGVMAATCIASAVATLLMGLLANYPISQAPLMGENFFFVFTVALGMQLGWEVALGTVCISGLIFLFLTFARIREVIADTIPEGLKFAIAGGIGIFIALLGLQQAGIVVQGGSLLTLGSLHGPVFAVFLVGFLMTCFLIVMRIKGGILIGMLCATLAGLVLGVVQYQGLVSLPPDLSPVFLKLNLRGALTISALPAIILLLFMLMFDTIGTLLGVSAQAGLLVDGKLPRISRALFSDAIGTVVGSLLGTSTVSSYIESSAGIQSGARTGLANMMTAALFLLALFFSPLVHMIGGGYLVPDSNPPVVLYPITAAGLIIVGVLMAGALTRIRWEDMSEAIPAFIIVVGIPFTFNIADGMAFGLILYPVCKLFAGRARDVHLLMWLLTAILVARFIFW